MLTHYLECYDRLLDEWLEKGGIEDGTRKTLLEKYEENIVHHSYEDVGMAVRFAHDNGHIDKRLFYRPEYFISGLKEKERNVDTRGIWCCRGIQSSTVYIIDHYDDPDSDDLVLQKNPLGLLTLKKHRVGLAPAKKIGVVIGVVL